VTVPVVVGVTFALPLVGCAPFHPPLAVQVVPMLADHVSVALWPIARVVRSAVSDAVGAGGLPEPPPYPPPLPPPQPASVLPSAENVINHDHFAAIAAFLFIA